MSSEERTRWNARYGEGTYRARPYPSPLLEEWLGRIRPQGRAMDFACGTGRNALRLAEAGYEVDAVDISDVAIDLGRSEAERRGLDVRWATHDLDQWVPPTGAYHLITVIRYRNEQLWSRLAAALVPDGWLLIEHHLRSGGAVDGPRTDAFRVAPQELLHAFAELRVVHYAEQVTTEEAASSRRPSRFALAHIVACNGDPATFGPPELAAP